MLVSQEKRGRCEANQLASTETSVPHDWGFSNTRERWSSKAAFTGNGPWHRETHETDRYPPVTNHKPWSFEPDKVNLCFLRGPLRWLTAVKHANVSWLLNFRIRLFLKSAVNLIADNLTVQSHLTVKLKEKLETMDSDCESLFEAKPWLTNQLKHYLTIARWQAPRALQ